MDITKRNVDFEELKGTKFSVIRDGNIVLLNDGEVTSDTEITERYMSEGYHTYDITEDSTIENSAYVNILEGKFIRVYTELTDTGVLKIKDQDGNTSNGYFEIYEGNIHNTKGAKLLDRNEYKDLYNKINVLSQDYDKDGIYKLSVTVINPVSIFVEVQKQQVGKNGEGIPNTKFTISRDENSKHENVLTNDKGTFDFKEEEVKPGDLGADQSHADRTGGKSGALCADASPEDRKRRKSKDHRIDFYRRGVCRTGGTFAHDCGKRSFCTDREGFGVF